MNVASITTHAPRLPHLRPVLDAVCSQVGIGRVLLLVAHELRLQTELAARGTRAELHVVEDIGPGKKHLAGLFCEADDVVITFDDDLVYTSDHAVPLLRAVRTVDAVCGFCGYDLAGVTYTEGPVAYLNGATSWAYRAGWAAPARVLAWGRDPACWHSDDIYMGRVFKDAGREVVVVPGAEHHLFPPANRGAWLVRESLMLHPDRVQRGLDCIRTAWADSIVCAAAPTTSGT